MDQAAALRSMPLRTRGLEARGSEAGGAIVVGSGKGGVGKSVLSVLLACALARRDRRVLLLDGSQNQGNLHILLGVRPAAGLTSLLDGEAEVEQLPVSVAPSLWLLPAESGNQALYALNSVDRARLHHRLSALYDDFDDVVVDGGPGIDSVVRIASIRSRRLMVVTVPEPAALSDAYALIKIVHLHVPTLPVGLLVNRTADEDEGRACFDRLSLAAQRFLGRQLEFLGSLPEDESLRASACRPGALLAAESAVVEATVVRLIGPGGNDAERTTAGSLGPGAETLCR